ncbi:patatin family protein [Paenalkalicoccus suaedae]|uniref:Patatin family protein n=1 Tax=Paenalkalicoccus suaedae TaxID=2592382 RepID=A0A859FD63_9BACI|nr:patatin family protein [Paenalkalicoccus suaedae]QKS71159.1 patatin family protein [Paenalkalicoccus suaedae]
MNNETGLVLEGGGMRGVFTSGVLEYLLDNEIVFPNVVGVSAGACNAASYISRQRGRNKATTIDYSDHPEYISFKRLFKVGELFNMDLIFDQIPNVENPFDYEAFFGSPQKLYVGVTDCISGDTVYYEKQQLGHDFNLLLRASSSLPMVAPPITYKDRTYLDGGISDPIPINHSIEQGNKKHVVVLTQQKGYQKKPAKRGMWYFRRKFQQFPGLIDIVQNRSKIYNNTLAHIEQLEREGQALVIRPESLFNVTRLERKRDRLEALYDHGYYQMKQHREELERFIEA